MQIYTLDASCNVYQGLQTEERSDYQDNYKEDISWRLFLLNRGKSINEELDPNHPTMGADIKPLLERGFGNTIKKMLGDEPIKVFYTIRKKTLEGKKILKGDVFSFDSNSALAFSKKALDVLGEEFLYKNGELITLECEDGIFYYVFNCLTEFNLVYYNTPKNVLNLEEINKAGIFKISKHNRSLYVSQAFIDKVKEHDLKGFEFKPFITIS